MPLHFVTVSPFSTSQTPTIFCEEEASPHGLYFYYTILYPSQSPSPISVVLIPGEGCKKTNSPKSSHIPGVTTNILHSRYSFAGVCCFRRRRKWVVNNLWGFMKPKVVRRVKSSDVRFPQNIYTKYTVVRCVQQLLFLQAAHYNNVVVGGHTHHDVTIKAQHIF